MNEPEVERLLRRIRCNCDAIARLMDEPCFPDANRAIHRRVQAFAMREEQLMRLVGGRISHSLAFDVFHRVLHIQ